MIVNFDSRISSMRNFILLLLIFPSLVYSQTLEDAINSFVSGQGMESASVSFEMVDLESKETILAFDPNRTLITASTAKLFSTATALDLLGPDFRATTRVYLDELPDSSGIVHGNIWIRGGGDPSLGSKYFTTGDKLSFMDQWIDTLKELEVTTIEGDLIADASEFGYGGVPDGWNWVDLGNYYGAGPSGLTLYDNLVEYEFSVPSAIGKRTNLKSVTPDVPGLTLLNEVYSSTNKGDNAYIFGAPYSYDRFATGTLPAGSTGFIVKGSIPDPERQFAYEFEKRLKSAGISVKGSTSTGRALVIDGSDRFYSGKNLIIEYEGEKLSEIIEQTNFRSINLFAEHMINLIGRYIDGYGSTRDGLKTITKHWSNKIDLEGAQITDGSGLSRMNAISAHHFTELLRYMYTSKYQSDFLASLPISGKSGTLRNVCKNQTAHGRIQAKSGSMSGVRSYAGYIETKNGKKMAFALIVNNANCSSYVLKRKMEVLFNQLVSY